MGRVSRRVRRDRRTDSPHAALCRYIVGSSPFLPGVSAAPTVWFRLSFGSSSLKAPPGPTATGSVPLGVERSTQRSPAGVEVRIRARLLKRFLAILTLIRQSTGKRFGRWRLACSEQRTGWTAPTTGACYGSTTRKE